VRDSRGRFASTPGGGKKAPSGLPKRSPRKAGTPPPKRRGLVTQRAAVRRASAKLKGLDTSGSYSGALRQRGQKAAVTRAGNQLKAAEATGRRRIAGGKVQGVVRMGRNRETTKKDNQSDSRPVTTGRTRRQAGRAQQARSRRLLRSVIRDISPGTATTPVFTKRTVAVAQGSLFGGVDLVKRTRFRQSGVAEYSFSGLPNDVTRTTRGFAAMLPLPSSQSGRRVAGETRRRSEDQFTRGRRIYNRASGITERRNERPGNYSTASRRSAQSMSTQGRALRVIWNAGDRALRAGGVMNALRNMPRYSTISNPDPSRPKSKPKPRRRKAQR
jgi:hypothetical protein